MKTMKKNLGVNLMAALAMLGAALTLVAMFVAFSAEGARVAGPKDVSGLVLWLDAATECSGVSDASAVSQWDDLSGTGAHAVQATGANQPTCQTASGDLLGRGVPVVNFNGSHYMRATAGSFGTASSRTMFVVARPTAFGGTYEFVLSVPGGGTSGQAWNLSYRTSTTTFQWWYGGSNNFTEFSTANTATQLNVFTVVSNTTGPTATFYRDGVADGSDAQAVSTHANLGYELGTFSGGSHTFNGDIAEILVYNSALSDVDRRAVEKYLRKKWQGQEIPVPSFYVSGKLPAKQQPATCPSSAVGLAEDFEEASGNLSVPAGCAASGTTLTATGGVTYNVDSSDGAFGGLGKAVTLNGTTGYFTTTADVNALDADDSESIVVDGWVRAASGVNTGAIVSKDNNSTASWIFDMNGNNGAPQFRVINAAATNGCRGASSTVINDGQWHYVRGVWNGSTNQCFAEVDGYGRGTNTQVDGTGDPGDMSNSRPVTIGCSNFGGNCAIFFNGSISDLRVCISTTAITDCPARVGGPGFSGFSGSTLTASTFTRATASTRVNPVTGLVEAVASGVPAVGAPLSSGDDGSIDVTEPTGLYQGTATTFLALNNEDITNASWTSDNLTKTANQAVAPDGATTADLCEPTSGAGQVYQAALQSACGSGATCTGTVWLKSATGANVSMSIHVIDNAGNIQATSALTVTTTWQRFVVTATSDGGDASMRLIVGGNNTWGVGENLYVWRPQIYAKAFAVPLDPAVTSSTVTINQDLSIYDPPVTNQNITVTAWNFNYASTSTSYVTLGEMYDVNDGGNPRLRFEINDATGNARFSNGSTTATFGTTPSALAWHHYAYTAVSGAQKLFVDGVQSGSTGATTYATENVDVFRIGNRTVGDNSVGFYSNIAVYAQILTPQQIRSIFLAKQSLYAAKSPGWKERTRVMLATLRFDPWYWFGMDAETRRRAEVQAARVRVASASFPKASWVMPESADAGSASSEVQP